MAENFDLDDFNMIDMNAKKVLAALSVYEKGTMIKGEQIHKKTGLLPEVINEAIRSLKRSMLVDISDALRNSPPYSFYAAEITDFGRQILERYG